MGLPEHLRPEFAPAADDDAVVRAGGVRVTVLGSRLLRVEYDPRGDPAAEEGTPDDAADDDGDPDDADGDADAGDDRAFEDRPTQTVWYRDRPVPAFDVERPAAGGSGGDGDDDGDGGDGPDADTGHPDTDPDLDTDELRVETDALRLTCDPTVGPESLSVALREFGTTYDYGDEDDHDTLGGATRTVDGVDGATSLSGGLLARDGWAVLEDTDSLVFGDDGWVEPRGAPAGYRDLYLFAYGHDYRDCLGAYHELTGAASMVPRWALGNWWSRYWAYTDPELRSVLGRFRAEGLPLSVCVVDMDWHVVENPHHAGWTGWTWNRELFPEPESFLGWLHDAGLRTTLNLHPADGVHPHEARYPEVARAVGVDPEGEDPPPVEFDAADTDFWRAYFAELLGPLEDDGVDFWWVDWQQYAESPRMDGLDPLWALNHLHARDRTRDGRRPFLLSRWPGYGGHRSPVGFSGDATISWASLAFQPYLTAAGATVSCGWWSHDVGGHYGGTGDPHAFGELYARWTQFGALSPVNRIHAGNVAFLDKRPWRYGPAVSAALGAALRRRHALVPYLYATAREYHETGVPPARPLYLRHPAADPAYHRPGQYYLGSELLAAPHVRPRGESTNLARRAVWLPGAEGPWFDVDSGRRYGPGMHVRHGDLEDVPLYAPAGAVLPLDADPAFGDVSAPDRLRVLAVAGADGHSAVYEDDGVSTAHRDGAFARTPVEQEWDGDAATVAVGPAAGDTAFVPDPRDVELHLRGVRAPGGDDPASAAGGSAESDPRTGEETLRRDDPAAPPDEDSARHPGDSARHPGDDGVGDVPPGLDVTVEGADAERPGYDAGTNTLRVVLPGLAPSDRATVRVESEGESLLVGDGPDPDREPSGPPEDGDGEGGDVDRRAGRRVDRRADRVRDDVETLLWHAEMPAAAKSDVLAAAGSYLTGDRADLAWLADAPTTDGVTRALAETVTGAGHDVVRHADRDRVVLFGGDRRADATYRFDPGSGHGRGHDGDHGHDAGDDAGAGAGGVESGSLPAFGVVELDDAGEDWELAVDYGDGVRVTATGEGRRDGAG